MDARGSGAGRFAPPVTLPTRGLAAGLGGYAFLAGLVSFLGYVFDVRRLTDWNDSGISIQPNTTIAAMAAGLWLVLRVLGHRRAAIGIGLLALFIGAATLFEWLSKVYLGIDGLLLFDREWGRRGVLIPGRMGPPAATSWTVLGLGLLLASRGPLSRKVAAALGLAVVLIASFSLIGYLYDVDVLYSLPRLTVIALQTSTMILVVALGLIVVLPDQAPMRGVLEPGAAGVLVRRALPFVIGLPIVLGWVRLRGQELGYYSTSTGTSLVILAVIVLTCAMLAWGAHAVAEHERALAALHESRLRADMVLGAARDQFVVVDRDWRYTYVNDRVAEITGMSREEMLGRSLWDIWPDARGTALEATAQRVMQDRKAEALEYHYAAWNRWFDIRLYPVGADGLAFFVLEITDRKRAEEALQDADHRKDQFLATLAHELRNPLAPLRSAVEILKRAPDDRALAEQARGLIERQVDHMVRLVDDLVDVSRITRDRLTLQRQRTPIAAVLQQAMETCRPLATGADQSLTLTLPDEPLVLDADRVRLVQVFVNLITNACKYTPRGGRIEVQAERRGSDIVVKVRDTGVGIPVEMLSRVFDLFTQLGPSLEHSQGGLGIGLALAKHLVEMHDGTISAHSDGSGRGSTFQVSLPLLIGALPSASPPEPEPQALPAAVRRILVVDDNRDLAEMVAAQLRFCGGETEIAHDGVEALGKAASFRPDVILLDIGLPRMSGYVVCRLLRGRPDGQSLVIVAMTGWGQDEDRRRSTAAGFDAHLVKPVAIGDLLRLLATLRPSAPA